MEKIVGGSRRPISIVSFRHVALSSSVCLLGIIAALGQENRTGTLNLTDWPVLGDGVTDDTAAIQKAIDSAAEIGGILLVPPGPHGGCYSSGNLILHSPTKLTIEGAGGKICLKGRGPGNTVVGLQYAGVVANLTVEGLEIGGEGPDEAHHAGIWGFSGTTISNLTIRNNYIHDVSLGVSVNADLGGTIDGFLIEGNRIENVIGSLPGEGYGIHHANGSGAPSNGRIVANTIVGAQRHSIYQAKGSAVIIADNTIKNHGIGRPTPGSAYPAIAVSRSTDISVIGNIVDGAKDGSLSIDTERPYSVRDIAVVGNSFSNPQGLFPMVTIGTVDPAHNGWPESVSFIGNIFHSQDSRVVPIQIQCGRHLNFVGNSIDIENAPGNVAAVQILGVQEPSGSAQYSGEIALSANSIHITVGKGVSGNAWEFYPAAAASAISVRISGNLLDIPSNAFLFEAAQADPNILVYDDDLGGALVPLLKTRGIVR